MTTDPDYFIAANCQKQKRVAAVVIRRELRLEACVLFVEHCVFGIGLGSLRGGDYMGESLVVGAQEFRLGYVQIAARALLERWRIHSVSVTVRACLDQTLAAMGPETRCRLISQRSIQHQLLLRDTYSEMLASMGPRTRRSLARKRQQLQAQTDAVFLPSLEPAQALDAMLNLRLRSLSSRVTRFYHARFTLLREKRNFFSMGLRLPDGTWLSVLSGWRLNQITYVDLQMNDVHYRKESLSAVMRAFLLENEILRQQKLINFVGGTSLLLRRYCQPADACTDIFLWRPCLRANLFRKLIARIKPDSVYVLFMPG